MASHELTSEEIQQAHARLAELRASTAQEDRLCAILMDTAIGGFGLYEPIARSKVQAILTAFTKEPFT